MKRRDSRSSSNGRRRHRSSRGKYESPSPERSYSHSRRDRERSRSRGKSRSHKSYYSEERNKYSPSEESNRASQSFKIICVTALHADASDETIKDVIYTEFKKYGDLVVKISHSPEERVAYIYFKTSEDAKDALKNKRRVLIYDKVAILEPVYVKPRHSSPERYRDRSLSRSPDYNDRYYRNGFPLPLTPEPPRYYERHPHYMPPMHIMPPEYRPLPGPPEFIPMPHPMIHPMPHHPMYGPRPFIPYSGLPYHPPVYQENINVVGTSVSVQNQKKFPNYLHHIPPEDDPLATRTLFAGNLEIGTVKEDLIKIFEPFGVVEDIDVKRPAVGSGTAYAFVRFKNLDMAAKAKVELSGKFIGKFQLKIGYGKATPTTRIWVGGLGEWTSSTQVEREFDRFGAIKKIDYDKEERCAYILYDSIDAATSAVKAMRGFPLGGSDRKLRLDFADVGSSSPYSSDYEYRARKRSSRTRSRSPRSRSRSRSHSRHNGNRSVDRSDDFSDDEHHYKSMKRGDRRPSSLSDAYSLSDVIATCNTTWEGGFVLKNSIFPVKFHLTDGSSNVIGEILDHESKHILRITQRLHLNPGKLNDVSKQIKTAPSFGIFLAVPTSSIKLSFDDDASLQTKSIQNLILYLKQKEAAGVLTLDRGVLYAFPPCAFSMDLLKRTAINVTDDNLKKDHLIIVVLKGMS